MAVYYLETSALLKRYRAEKGTELLDELFNHKTESEVFTTSYFTVLEVTSVATRLLRAGNINRRAHQQLLGDFALDMRQLIMSQPVSQGALNQAVNLITGYALRAPDALQLATAIVLRSSVPNQPFYFLCTDARLKAASEASGVPVLDPEAANGVDMLRGYRRGG